MTDNGDLEHAALHDQSRRGPQAMVKALTQLRQLRPPCWRCQRTVASCVATIDNEYHAICSTCAQQHALNRQIARQRQVRAAMGPR
jgi:hypothetical protein